MMSGWFLFYCGYCIFGLGASIAFLGEFREHSIDRWIWEKGWLGLEFRGSVGFNFGMGCTLVDRKAVKERRTGIMSLRI